MPLPMERTRNLTPSARRDYDALRERFVTLGPVIVAFSGGADSSLLAWMANEICAPGHAQAITAVSPSLADDELTHCQALAASWGLDWRPVYTEEFANVDYVRNDADRCFHCKHALMDAIEPLASAAGATVVLGVNIDDLGDHRPGQVAAADRGAVFPFVEAAMSKAAVRDLSRQLGLVTWDKPAAPCLASRLPYGTPVTMRRLSQVERGERVLRELGFEDMRVRHYGETARIEVPDAALGAVIEHRQYIAKRFHDIGFGYVTVDLEPLRSGNLNHAGRAGDGRAPHDDRAARAAHDDSAAHDHQAVATDTPSQANATPPGRA